MAIINLLYTFSLTLSLLTPDAFAAHNHPRRIPHAEKPSLLLRNEKSPYERLLPGAGCQIPLPPEIKAPKRNVWAHLTHTEGHQISKFLHGQKELNLTRRNNYIYDMQLTSPNKTDVLQYFDHDGSQPVRYASVLLGDTESDTPSYVNLLVGPLPVSNATTYQPLTYPFTNNNGGKIRMLYGNLDYRKYSHFLKNITDSVKDITNDLWNTTSRHYDAYSGQDPTWQYDGKITEWAQYWGYSIGDFASDDLLPLGLYYKVTIDYYGSDPDSWTFGGWLYNNIYYATTEDFRAAYAKPGFVKNPPNIDGTWTHTDQKGPILPLDDEAPPMPVAKTARFSVDFRQQYVEWMGFSFYISFHEETGMRLHDISFKGERIIYELGMEEALAHYAGIDPVQSGTSYLDSAYGLGYADSLFPGYDCPTYATYLNISVVAEYTFKEINAACLFEFDADYSMQRHSTQSNTKNIYFVVRSISTVGNYDYMFSYEFYMDGSIQISVRAAGYIQSAYYAANEDYGYHIHDALSGSMHDHVLNFKADFDILGTANTMELVTVKPVTQNYVWSDQPRNTMKLFRHEVESEDESRLKWQQNGATQYRIVNKDKPNKFGEYRGFRILPSQGTIHLSVDNSSNLVNAANWAYDDLAITKQKDTEPRSANPYNGEDVYNPLVNFDDFFDGESLIQEDLVVWFNLGMHHLPHTGDLPNTVYTTAHSAVQITPSNYFAYDQSRDTVNMVRLGYSYKTNSTVTHLFGQAAQVCKSDLDSLGGGGYY